MESLLNVKNADAAPALWGSISLWAEFFHFVLFWTTGPFIGQQGTHPIAVSIFLFGWLLGFVGGFCAIIGLFKDRTKWLSIAGLILFPLSIIVTI
jgi:hypothetical protein